MRQTRILLTAFSLGSSALSFIAYTLLLRQFGAGDDVDAYFYASSVPAGVAGLVSAVLIYLLPARMTEMEASQSAAACSFALRCTASATMMALPVAAVLAHGYGASPRTLAMTLGLTFNAGLTVAGAIQVSRAQASGAYLLAAFNQFAPVLGLALGVGTAVLSDVVWPVVLGQMLGSALAVSWLTWRLPTRAAASLPVQAWAELMRPLRPFVFHIATASTAFTLFQPIDAWLCRRLDDGAITILAFAQRVWIAAGVVISLGAHTIAARTARDAVVTGGNTALRAIAQREVYRILVAGIVVLGAFQLIGPWGLHTVFSYGSMTAAQLDMLVDTVEWMLLSAPAMAAVPYLFRVLYTLRDYRVAAWVGGATPMVYALVSSLLIPWFALRAMPIALAVAWWCALGAVLLHLNSRLRAAD